MKILLTGATGFIGSHVARVLIEDSQHDVFAIIRSTSDRWRIEPILSNLHLIECDLLDFDKLNDHLSTIKPDLCIHVAWYVVAGKYPTSPINLEMVQASLNLVSQLASLGCRRFIGIGTCFEYDTSLGYLSEDSPTKPNNLYAASKVALQTVLDQYAQLIEMEIAWLRLFYLYGPLEGERRLVPAVINALLQGKTAKVTRGEQIRDFLHAEDMARAVWAVAQSQMTGVVNIGSGQPIAVRDLVIKIGDIFNRPDLIALGALPYSPNDPPFICANNRKLIDHSAWTPKYDLEQGLQDAIAWWQSRSGMM